MGRIRQGAALSLSLAVVGCSTSPVTLQFVPVEGALIGGGVRLETVTVDPAFYGRGCLSIEVSDQGEDVFITLQQDGSTDWIVGRALPAVGREVVTAALAFASAPFKVIEAALGIPPAEVPGPSEVHGCGGLFED